MPSAVKQATAATPHRIPADISADSRRASTPTRCCSCLSGYTTRSTNPRSAALYPARYASKAQLAAPTGVRSGLACPPRAAPPCSFVSACQPSTRVPPAAVHLQNGKLYRSSKSTYIIYQRAHSRKVRYPVGYFEDELQQEGLEYSAGTRSRTSRAGPRGAGKQARAQRHMMRSP